LKSLFDSFQIQHQGFHVGFPEMNFSCLIYRVFTAYFEQCSGPKTSTHWEPVHDILILRNAA